MADLDAPDLAEPIRAYRQWTMRDSTLFGFGLPWPTREPLTAVCRLSDYFARLPYSVRCDGPPSSTAAGHAGHGCGIYAYRRPTAIPFPTPVWGGVAGEVDLWGRVYEHLLGWRAEFARVVCLYDLGGDPPLRAAVAETAHRYDVPVVHQPALAEWARTRHRTLLTPSGRGSGASRGAALGAHHVGPSAVHRVPGPWRGPPEAAEVRPRGAPARGHGLQDAAERDTAPRETAPRETALRDTEEIGHGRDR